MKPIVPSHVQVVTQPLPDSTLGVDTHKDTHTYAVLTNAGVKLGVKTFSTTQVGHAAAVSWARTLGNITAAGVECSANYGAGLTRYLQSQSIPVVEVNVVDKQARARAGKTDEYDAVSAARLVLSGRCASPAKELTGLFFDLAVLINARDSAVKAQTQTMNVLKAVLVKSPDEYRQSVVTKSGTSLALVKKLASTRPNLGQEYFIIRTTLKSLAARWLALRDEAMSYEATMLSLMTPVAKELLDYEGIGVVGAGIILSHVGADLSRFSNRDDFCKLAGVSPRPVSSGMTDRYRLDRGGDRQLNKAMYHAAMTRARKPESASAAYIEKRVTQGKTKRDAVRCLKKYIARDIYTILLSVYKNL